MVSVLGSASGVFAVSARQLQSKAQGIWQDLKKDAANSGPAPKPTGIQDFIDPDTRARLEAQKKDADSLAQKLASGGEDAKEAAARKKEEAKQKLKMLKLQAQLAAASGDKKAAARIAKEAATVAKELGQAAKDASGGDSTSATGTAQVAASGSGEAATASAEAQAVAQQANQTANQGGEAVADEQTPAGQEQAAGTMSNADIQAQRDAIIRDGSARAGEAREEAELRTMMDQLRAIHQQMKNLARKDGSPGTKAEMERASQDMEEGDRAMADAFGPPGVSLPTLTPPPPASIDIRA
ncbi:hypothetical protein [Niveispirillum sp. KHB5.9]|uniref:hypothetical protein n=1 Tax=Niveispirillum sp. KHB5.9 TaxID=3400269 RepID=UPI003A874A67